MSDFGASTMITFLWTTIRRNWCRKLQDEHHPGLDALRQQLMDDLSLIKEDLDVLRGADKQVAVSRFTRGVELLLQEPKDDSAWKEDMQAALDSAENGYHRVRSIEHKILCMEIMCSCFLVLRNPENAVISIQNTVASLFQDNKKISAAIQRLDNCIHGVSPLTPEDKVFLEFLFSRVCGIITACEQMDEYYYDDNKNYRDRFRAIFANMDALKHATDPSAMGKWDDTARIYKYSSATRVYGTAAHVLVPVVPVLSATATIMTAGWVRPKGAGVSTYDTMLLKDAGRRVDGNKAPRSMKDRMAAVVATKKTTTTTKVMEDAVVAPSLYDFRWHLLDLAHCKSTQPYALGNVRLSLSRDSNENQWVVDPISSDRPMKGSDNKQRILKVPDSNDCEIIVTNEDEKQKDCGDEDSISHATCIF